MEIRQFENKSLSHYSYAIISENREIVLVDPSRNIHPYMEFAERHGAQIIGVIETHPHADFISGHLELHKKTGANIYASKLTGAAYPHLTFDDGDVLTFGDINLRALNTPGHSPDGISIVLEHAGKDKAVFTGDTLFIGDCGRPDLRESAGSTTSKREDLARQMYASLREKLMNLNDEVLVYPAHGAGTLCGKSLSDAKSSTIGEEKISNWSLQQMLETEFIEKLTRDQPYVPFYFPYDVELNRKGAPDLQTALEEISIDPLGATILDDQVVIVDGRPAAEFKKSHLNEAVNIMADGKFETWLGSLIKPGELFYLAAENEKVLRDLIFRAADIGYESFILEGIIMNVGNARSLPLDIEAFKQNLLAYTIVDVRNFAEVAENPGFEHSIHIPLPELRDRLQEIPLGKPIMVHCAGGYRSAAASSILESRFSNQIEIFDLSTAVKAFI
jgi:hydroxyacylglutathione hydrolase